MPLSTIPASPKSAKRLAVKNFSSSQSTAASSSSSSYSTSYSPLVIDLRLPALDTVIGDSLIGSDLAAFSPTRIRSISPPPPPSAQPVSPAQVSVAPRVKLSRRGRISSEIPIIVDARKAYIRPSAPFRSPNYSSPSTKRNATLPVAPPFLERQKVMQSSSETVVGYGTSSASSSVQSSSVVKPSPEPVDESSPLLRVNEVQKKKPFYRARPLWLVPFAITASVARGMTLAPRIEVYTQLSCAALHRGDWNHTQTQELYPTTPDDDLLFRATTSWALAPSTNSSTVSVTSTPSSHNLAFYASLDPLGPPLHAPSHSFLSSPTSYSLSTTHSDLGDDPNLESDDPRRLPSTRCLSDPAVQSGAARLQMMMTTIMGLLSALTTGWWGHFGERHGRTRVLAVSTLGLFLTDLTFILVSTPSSPLSHHGHKLLLLAPIIEGLLGGWSTLQSAASAYISDCTSSGSRAQVFSRFTGVFYLGLSLGPAVGGWVIANGLPVPWLKDVLKPQKTVTAVFWVSIFCSFVNFLLVTFIFPESLSKEKRDRAILSLKGNKGKQRARGGEEETAGGVVDESLPILQMPVGDNASGDEESTSSSGSSAPLDGEQQPSQGIIAKFLSPLAVFLPVTVLDPYGLGRKRKDWSLTLLAGALFGVMLSTGIFQIKYLYAVHIYGWNAEQLSYYISAMGGSRAIFLLFLLPTLIGFFKPKPVARIAPTAGLGSGKKAAPQALNRLGQPAAAVPPTSVAPSSTGKKPKPTRAQLGVEISFDLVLTRLSMMIDIISHTLVSMLPAPEFKMHMEQLGLSSSAGAIGGGLSSEFQQSQALFVLASGMNSMGSGAVPAMQSLALCILQVRKMDERIAAGKTETDEQDSDSGSVGPLFGALAVVQAVGQMILGPMLFGVVYSGTVAKFPKAIFVLAAGILVCALAMVALVRNPVRSSYPGRYGNKKVRRDSLDIERGRSRVSKDLRGGAVIHR